MKSPADPVYRAFGEGIRFSGGCAEEVLIDPLSGRVHVLSAAQMRVLGACRGERTLDAHAAEASRRLGTSGGGPEAVRALVETLALKELFVPASALREVCAKAAREREAPALTTLGIPTNGRPASLAACVKSHVEAARAQGRTLTCVVADSASGEVAEATRAALAALGMGSALRRIGIAEREAFASQLAKRAGVDPEIVRFALLGDARIGFDSGANRNALLLDQAGSAFVMGDDDVRARAAPAPSLTESFAHAPAGSRQHEGFALASADPSELWFADAGEALVAAERWRAIDPLALHATLLGRDVARMAVNAGDFADHRHAGAALYRKLARRGGRIVTTQLGGAGDHGMGGSFGLLLLGGASRERLLASEARFLDAFARRRAVRCAPRLTASEGSACMAMSLGVDARELVPPFAPAGRDSDGLFGATLRACLPDAFSGFLPWAIEHTPAEARSTSFELEQRSAGRAGVNELLRMALAAAFDPRDTTTEANLVRAGLTLQNLVKRPRDADRFFREQTMRGLARRLAHIERTLAEHARKPAAWALALDGFAAALRQTITSPFSHLPSELSSAPDPETARTLFFEHVGRVGKLFEAWPALFQAAKDLRSQA